MKNKKGFTIIELLVAMAIIGVLAAIVIPRFAGQQTSAQKNKVLADLSSLDAALQLYYLDNNNVYSGANSFSELQASGYIVNVPPAPAINGDGASIALNGGNPLPYSYYTYSILYSGGNSYNVARACVSVSYLAQNGSVSGWSWYKSDDLSNPATGW